MPIADGPGGYKVARLGSLRLWAERGLVHIEDERDNSYVCLTVLEAIERATALLEMLRGQRRELHEAGVLHREEWDRRMAGLGEILEVIRQAREQGPPDDPQARQEAERRAPRLFVVSRPEAN